MVVQGEFDTSPRLSLRWKTLADARNPVAQIRAWGRSIGCQHSCYRIATGWHGTRRQRTVQDEKAQGWNPNRTALHDAGSVGRETVYQICTQGSLVRVPPSPPILLLSELEPATRGGLGEGSPPGSRGDRNRGRDSGRGAEPLRRSEPRLLDSSEGPISHRLMGVVASDGKWVRIPSSPPCRQMAQASQHRSHKDAPADLCARSRLASRRGWGGRRPTLTVMGFDRGRNARPAHHFRPTPSSSAGSTGGQARKLVILRARSDASRSAGPSGVLPLEAEWFHGMSSRVPRRDWQTSA